MTIPSSVVDIKDGVFDGCKSLKEVVLEERSRLEKIGSACFRGTWVEGIVIPKGVEEIRESTFTGCEHLKEVVFEEGSWLKTIEERAFSDCASLKNIRFPNGLRQIGAECFS